MKSRKKILIILGFILLIGGLIFGIIKCNSLPSYKITDTEVDIIYFDTNREIYNEYPFCKDKCVTYGIVESKAFISIHINATSGDMRTFDRTRQSEIKSYMFSFARSIPNPHGRDIYFIISNEKKRAEKTIIYTAHLNWDEQYNMPGFPERLERKVKYDKPLG